MTGEFQPLDVSQGDLVVGGTVSVNGRLVVRATKVGRDTQLAQMLALVEHAQNEKAAVQRLLTASPMSSFLGSSSSCLSRWPPGFCSDTRAIRRLHRRPFRPRHCLSVRPRSGHTGRPVRDDGRRSPSRDLLQGISRAGGIEAGRHRRTRHGDRCRPQSAPPRVDGECPGWRVGHGPRSRASLCAGRLKWPRRRSVEQGSFRCSLWSDAHLERLGSAFCCAVSARHGSGDGIHAGDVGVAALGGGPVLTFVFEVCL